MLWITLDECKQQVRVAPADTTHDAELTRFANASETWAAKYLNRISAAALEDLGMSGQSPPVMPEDIKSAVLLHVQMLFEGDLEGWGMNPDPKLLTAAKRLLDPYRVDGIGV